ncbi:lipopolysaccharide biosynthesis protein [Rhizorhabdus dicambivorans]|uniref:Polysaccharide biosynthesis protein n=1 Tax=Rhizorhabdus dicambivorans TaxID=1850238 RepID=A0A2A4FXM7_9SPHN|nr:lipopolysaccharide biosynthesis protein [Rhizorhabdus dicambivorans]ATE63028.1 polysaccharide biosynthesis protein [Rhizorhabdus dicambivorans]PCE43204.1 polysaccharide biosynthesis protein [Rhizorhabdus dicambivorans]
MTAAAAAQGGGAVFARMGRNLVWLLGGRGFQAVASLVYLGVAARALGPAGFGLFSLILAYGQAIANVAQLQSWQTVIRYGMIHLAKGRRDRLARLLGFTTLLDIVGALLGAAAAVLAVPLVAAWLDWNPAQQQHAAWFGVALLLSIGATPTGMLRLVDRFELIAYVQAVGPSVRLAGSLVAWATGGGIELFLAAWAAAALAQHAATWAAALALTPLPIALGRRQWHRANRENAGIWRFMLTTNAAGTLGLLTEQLGTLAVGGVAGAAAAGGYRIAARIARALARPIQIAARIVYPEMARLHAGADLATLDHVMARVSRYALGLAAAVILIGVAGGPWLIMLLAGRDYGFAQGLLSILAVGVAIDLSGFALEPRLVAHGRAGAVLRIRLAGAALFAFLLAVLLPLFGAIAAASATVAASLLMRVWMGREAGALQSR